jgi:hypothetical protein
MRYENERNAHECAIACRDDHGAAAGRHAAEERQSFQKSFPSSGYSKGLIERTISKR